MSKARPKHGQKADKGLKDIKIRNEAKYQSELSPTTIESTPEAKEQEFQNNLDYLLTNKERPAIVPDEQTYVTANVIEEIEIGVASQSGRNSGKPKASKRSARRNNFTVAEIVKDIGGLQFSSDDDEGVNLEIESVAVTSSHGPAKRNKKKPKKKNQEKKTLNECVGRTQVITDENPNGASSSEKIISEHNNNSNGGGKEEPSQVCVSKDNKTLPNKVNTEPKRGAEKRKNSTKKDSKRGAGKDKLTHNNDEQGVSTSESKSPVKKSTKDKKSNQTRNHKQPPAVQDGETTLSKDDSKQNTKPSPIKSEHGQAPQTELKRKKNKSARKREPSKSRTDNTTSSPKVGLEKTHAPSRGVPGNPTKDNTIANGTTDNTKAVNLEKDNSLNSVGEMTTDESELPEIRANSSSNKRNAPGSANSVSSLFGVTLKPLKSSSTKSEHLPELSPIKTIIGVSHQQILTADLSDVKIKTIMNAPSMSKYASNCMKFVKKYENEIFDNYNLKKQFLILCFNVALYESNGFKKSVSQYPDILDNFGHYDELNLTNTHTAITVSGKESHRNTLDYSMFAYFGHILIWALHLQRRAKASLFTDEYNVSISPNEIKMKIGGLHLWDRIFRELKGMNAKRWKHVLKFRNMFALEEDQFMVILRFMRITNIP